MLGNLFGQRNTIPQATAAAQPVPAQPAAPASEPAMNLDTRQEMSVLSHLDVRSSRVLANAQKETKALNKEFIEPQHVLLGLLWDPDIFNILSKSSINPAKLSEEIKAKEIPGTFAGQPILGAAAKKIFDDAYAEAKKRNADFITPEDLLSCLISSGSVQALSAAGINPADIQKELAKSPAVAFGKRSALEQFGIDLTEKAKKGELDPTAARDKEIERLIHILLRRSKNNPVIIGEAGVGKTAIVEGLAQLIASGAAPASLAGKKIIQLEVSSLIAGASHRGEFEDRLRRVIKEAQASAGSIILFIDEIHTLIGAGENEGGINASDIIKPYLSRGEFQVMGTTTTSEYRKYFEKDKAFSRRFQPVLAEEPSEEDAAKMITVLKPRYEAYHKVVISGDVINEAVKLSKRYVGERFLPDKAVDVLDEAAAQVRLLIDSGKRQDNQVLASDIQKVISAWTGIPITKLTEKESEKLINLEKIIHQKLINQENAVVQVAEAIRRGRIGLSSAQRPIASFVFLGPTGVGKTELAKTLAEILFGRADAMVRLDMSEYMEKHEVAKLIGAPPGYVGYEEGGQLTEAVRLKPFSIVLFDEIEKAHPDVFNILLALLEDGRLTDNKGNTISFKNTIVIGTSNIGSSLIQEKLGNLKPGENAQEIFSKLQKDLLLELRKFFKPELLNRFDGVTLFEPLNKDHMQEIAKLGISSTRKLLLDQGIDLEVSLGALLKLAQDGYDPQYGARPLRRLIQSAIENPISLSIIKQEFAAGDKVLVDYDSASDKFTFIKVPPPAPQQAVGAAQSAYTPADAQTQQPVAEAIQSVPPLAAEGIIGQPPPLQQNPASQPLNGSFAPQAE